MYRLVISVGVLLGLFAVRPAAAQEYGTDAALTAPDATMAKKIEDTRNMPIYSQARLSSAAVLGAALPRQTTTQQEMADALDLQDRGKKMILGGAAAVLFGQWVGRNGSEPCDEFTRLLEADCGQTKLSLLGWGIFGVGGLYVATGIHDYMSARSTISRIGSTPSASLSLSPHQSVALNLDRKPRVTYHVQW